MVENTKVDNQYLEHIREVHDPSLQLKTLEDELKRTIGGALGKQGEKIVSSIRKMKKTKEKYYQLVEKHGFASRDVLESAKLYNAYRKDSIQARWELIVHRQAVGFTVGNHKCVMETFPIGGPLSEDASVITKILESSANNNFPSDSREGEGWTA